MKSAYFNGGVIGVGLNFGTNDQHIIGQSPGTITYVGGRTQTTLSTTNFTVSLTGLTGGLAASPVQGDLVVVTRAYGSLADQTLTTSNTGWTQLPELYADDSFDINFSAFYKIMPVTPDTLIIFNGHPVAFQAEAIIVQVFRGVDTTTPLDVAATTSSIIDSGLPNPAAITPISTNSIILVAGGGGHNDGVDTFTASYLTNFLTVGANSTGSSATAGMGWVNWTSGTYDPAAFTATYGSNFTSFSSAAITMALRPAQINTLGQKKNSGIWNIQSVYDWLYIEPGEQNFTTVGTTNFIVPAGVYQISAVAIGGGGGGSGADGARTETNTGGGGGALAYGTIPVTPGELLTVVVGAGGTAPSGNPGGTGGISSIIRGVTTLLSGGGGGLGRERSVTAGTAGVSGGTARQGGGNGGAGGTAAALAASGGTGGGGAGGYSGNGGTGGNLTSNGSTGAGGGGGGGGGRTGTTAVIAGSGGGVGIFGSGADGTGGTAGGGGGNGGSGGASGVSTGGLYGGGGGARVDNAGAGYAGGQGAVRIIWGTGRFYPSNRTGTNA